MDALVCIPVHVMAQIFKSGDLSNLMSFDSISGGFLSNYYFNAC